VIAYSWLHDEWRSSELGGIPVTVRGTAPGAFRPVRDVSCAAAPS
jgi:hypothetical protein